MNGLRGWPFALTLLGTLSLASFGGPFLILLVVMGGESNRWPPDRSIEWIVTGAVVALELVLLVACVTIRWWGRPFLDPTPDPSPVPKSNEGPAIIP